MFKLYDKTIIMKSLVWLMFSILIISACQEEEGGRKDNSKCTCKNSDHVVVGTYTGLTYEECMEKSRPDLGETCILD